MFPLLHSWLFDEESWHFQLIFKVEICWTPKCEKKFSQAECYWHQEEDPGACYSQHSMCVVREQGGCHWAKTTLLKKCMETVEQDGRLEPLDSHHRAEYGHESEIGTLEQTQQEVEFSHHSPLNFEP